MPPPHEVSVVSRPGRRLVREIGEKAQSAPLEARQTMDEGQSAARDYHAPRDLPARVVLGPRARAYVHDLGRDVGVLAVVGEGHRQVGEAREHPGQRAHLFEDGLLRRPAKVAPEVRVPRLSIGREALDMGLREAGGGSA
jgi:hypothetical protein